MHLNRIQTTGLKGHSQDVSLTGCDVFAGPNGSGKTSIILAILAGLRGLRETQDGKGSGVYLGPRRPEGTVELTFDGGSVLRDLGAVRGKTRTAQDTRADLLVGPHLVSWDLGDYASGSDQSRRELLSRVLTAAGSSSEWSRDACVKWLTKRLDTPELPWTDKAVSSVLVERTMESFSVWLDRATARAEEAQSEWNSRKSAISATIDELTTQRREAEAIPAGRLEDTRRELADTHRQLQEISTALATLDQAARAARAHQAEGDRLAKAVSSAETELQRVRGALQAAKASIVPDIPRLAAIKAEAAEAEKQAHAAYHASVSALDDALKATEATGQALASAQADVALLRQLADTAGTCRHCGGQDPLDLVSRLAQAEDALALAEDVDALARSDRSAATRRREKAEAAYSEAQRASSRAIRGHEEAVSVGAERSRRVQEAAEVLPRVEEALKAAEASLAEWQARPLPVVGGDLETLTAQRDALQEAAAKLQAETERLARLQGAEGALQAAIAGRDTATSRWRRAKAFVGALRELRGEVTRAAYAPLTESANGLLYDAGIRLQVYMESESDWGAEHESRVHWHALSDGERAVCAAALAYAFAVVTRAPWRAVILDRLEAVDRERRGRLVAVLRERGVQVVAAERADRREEISYPETVTVQWMGR